MLKVKSQPLVRLPVALACIVFVVSVFYPFLHAKWDLTPSMFHDTHSYWSFKSLHVYRWEYISGVKEETFAAFLADYWSVMGDSLDPLEKWTEPILILMLEAQISGVLFALLTVFKRAKLYPIILATSFNLLALFCMGFVLYAQSTYFYVEFTTGFWLSLVSAILFLTALTQHNQMLTSPRNLELQQH